MLSLIMIGFTESDVISGVDGEISCVDVVSLQSGFQQFWVMNSAVLLEVDLLVLSLIKNLRWCWHRRTWTPRLRRWDRISIDPLQSRNRPRLCGRIWAYPQSKACRDWSRTSKCISRYRGIALQLSGLCRLLTRRAFLGGTWNQQRTRFLEWWRPGWHTGRNCTSTMPIRRGSIHSSRYRGGWSIRL